MSKQEVRNGAMLDIPTLNDIEGMFSQHINRVTQALMPHVKYRRLVYQVNADGTGNLNVNTNQGPEPGFLWEVNRLAVINAAGNAGAIALYLNSNSPGDLVYPSVNCPGNFPLISPGLVVEPGNTLYLVGSGLGATASIYLTGQVKEIAVNQIDRLQY